jgi:arylsulfatase A-like enzyme
MASRKRCEGRIALVPRKRQHEGNRRRSFLFRVGKRADVIPAAGPSGQHPLPRMRSLFHVLVVVALCGIRGSDAAPTRPPNVVLVVTDDQGYGDFGVHGNPVLKTPHLDRLHAESIRLTDFHVSPMCTPTRGQLITGRDALANGAMNVSSGRTMLRRELPTMADIFAASGYRCGQFGKWHLGDNYPFRPHDRGFHEAIYYPSSHIGSAPDAWDNHYLDDVYLRKGERRRFSGYTTDVFFDEAMKWMRVEAEAKRPFFCYLATAAAHGPLFVPERYRKAYEGQTPQVAAFFGMIANLDENMARLDAFLTERGLRDDTLVIFMTDNGGTAGVPVFNAGMRGRKIDLWEGGHRVPCFIRWPKGGLRPAGDVGALTEVQDVLPTLVDLCALKRGRAEFDGVSLAPLLRGETESLPDRSLVVQFSRMQAPVPQRGDAAVLWRKWRLVADKELYDLTADFGQKTNVIAEHPDVAARLRADYERWWRNVSPRMNEVGAIVVGSDAENVSLLSPADWVDVFFDQGAQVRSGVRRNGAWNLFVERAGEYEIELRRWPREADVPIAAGIPARPHAFGKFAAGVALPIARARLSIGHTERAHVVNAGDLSVIERVKLERGPARLQTWFSDAEGNDICGAYYVYVTRK